MAKRLSKQERREQLLSVADSIVRANGTEALTLITLADKAGVTKALTYDHFSTREGLLIQLYRRYDERVIAATQAAISSGAKTIECAAEAVVVSYIECTCYGGNQYEAIVSALLAYPDYQDIRLRIRDFFADAYEEIFRCFMTKKGVDVRLRFIAIFGAIEEVARSVSIGEYSVEEAIAALKSIIVAILKER